MKSPPSLWMTVRNSLILLLLLAIILLSRPAAGELDLGRARRLETAGNYPEAAAAYARAAERIPWQPSLWETAGRSAWSGGNAGDAVRYLEKAAQLNAITPQGWLSLGLAEQELGDLSAAVNAWQNARPLADAYRFLAQTERQAGDLQAAMDDWRLLVAGQPEDAQAHYQLGLLLAATAPENALPELLQAARLDPSLSASVQGLRIALNTASLSDDRAYQFLLAGRALGALGEWDLSAEAFRSAVTARPAYADAWAWLGEAGQHLGQDGSEDLQKAVTLDPGSVMVQALYGLYWQRQGQPAKALETYQKAADLEPGNPAWQVALGSAYEQKGDLIAAYSCYLRAVELSPQDVTSWRALATFSVDNNVDVSTTGQAAVEQLLDLAPHDWQTYDLAGQLTFSQGKYDEAKTFLKKAIELNPAQAAPALHLALACLQTNDLAAARIYLDQAQSLDPAGPSGWQAGRLLEQYFP